MLLYLYTGTIYNNQTKLAPPSRNFPCNSTWDIVLLACLFVSIAVYLRAPSCKKSFSLPLGRGDWRRIAPSGNQVLQTLCDIESDEVQLIFASSNSWWSAWRVIGSWQILKYGPCPAIYIPMRSLADSTAHSAGMANGVYIVALYYNRASSHLAIKWKSSPRQNEFSVRLSCRESLVAVGRKVARSDSLCWLFACDNGNWTGEWSKSPAITFVSPWIFMVSCIERYFVLWNWNWSVSDVWSCSQMTSDWK